MMKAILFDLDQTLLDRNRSVQSFLNWQINFYNLVPDFEKENFIQRFLELDANGSVWKDIVYEKLIQEFQIEAVDGVQLLESYVGDLNKFCIAFADVPELIQNLYLKGYKLGLISNGKTPFQENNFKALGIQQYFSSILVSDAVHLRKPDSQIFLFACQQLQVQPRQCVFVGDNETADIRGANEVGMKTIFFNTNVNINSQYADATLHHYADFWTVLEEIQKVL